MQALNEIGVEATLGVSFRNLRRFTTLVMTGSSKREMQMSFHSEIMSL
jgi:hypothetical protein